MKVGGKEQHMCLHLEDYEDENDENDDEEDKHKHDDDVNEGQWEGVADVPATSGATWLPLGVWEGQMLGFAFKNISFFYNTFVSIAFCITSILWTVVGLGGFWLNGTSMCVPRYM